MAPSGGPSLPFAVTVRSGSRASGPATRWLRAA